MRTYYITKYSVGDTLLYMVDRYNGTSYTITNIGMVKELYSQLYWDGADKLIYKYEDDGAYDYVDVVDNNPYVIIKE